MVRSKSPKHTRKVDATTASSRRGRIAVRLPDQETHRRLPGAEQSSPESKSAGKTAGRGKQKRGDDVRGRVVKAALECFGAFGFEGTSTRAVAHRAQVSHTLLLYHFRSKDQLWIATMEDALNKYMEEMSENFSTSAQRSAKDGLRVFIEQFVRMSARQPQIHRILTMESNQGTKRLRWVIDHYLRKHYAWVRDLIRRGQTEGSVRECDPARLYYHIVGAGGTPFTISTEYKELTGRDVFSEAEILRNIAFIYEIVFR
jgi:TetR/AcrR family transcriptional regulator